VGAVLLFFVFISLIVSIIKKIKNRKPRMMLLTSSGMTGSKQDIMAILPKPPEDIRVAHIITATKPEEDKSYAIEDERLMKEAGFNVEQIDIEGKNQAQLLHLLINFDIIYVQGGNTFYLLKCMRDSGFKKVMKKLFRIGIIYIGVSAGSVVVGKNIETAHWYGDKNIGIANLTGLKFVPFSIFVHYTPEFAEIIKKQSKGVKKKLKILQDGQAIFVLDRQTTFVGEGEVINAQNL
jgi:dipeptidase E